MAIQTYTPSKRARCTRCEYDWAIDSDEEAAQCPACKWPEEVKGWTNEQYRQRAWDWQHRPV